jgi:hypothetical protein
MGTFEKGLAWTLFGLSSATILAACASSSPAGPEGGSQGTMDIPASAETSSALGVTRWHMSIADPAQMTFQGLDSKSTALISFELSLTRAGAPSAYAAEIRTNVDSQTATMDFAVDTMSLATVTKNELRGRQDVARAIDRFSADFQQTQKASLSVSAPASLGANGLLTTPLRPLDGTGGTVENGGTVTGGADYVGTVGGPLVPHPGQDLLCTWQPQSGLTSTLVACGSTLLTCGGALAAFATPGAEEAGFALSGVCQVNGGLCQGVVWGNIIKNVMAPPHYNCQGVPCIPFQCSESAPPAHGFGYANQAECYRFQTGGKPITDQSMRAAASECGCSVKQQGCDVQHVQWVGGGPNG